MVELDYLDVKATFVRAAVAASSTWKISGRRVGQGKDGVMQRDAPSLSLTTPASAGGPQRSPGGDDHINPVSVGDFPITRVAYHIFSRDSDCGIAKQV